MRHSRYVVAWAKLLVAAGLVFQSTVACQSNEPTEFPPGLEPLEDSTADLPMAVGINIVTGSDGYKWGHARARIDRSASDVWATLKDPNTIIATWSTDKQVVEILENSPYEFAFIVAYTVNDILTVEWQEEWRYGVIEGDSSAPEFAIARHQKFHGSSFISLIEGALIVTPVDDSQTEVSMVQHVDAVQAKEGNIRESFEHFFANLVTGT